MTLDDGRCKVCCMPPTRPDTPFDGGICQACINHEARKHIDWDWRATKLQELLDSYHGEVAVASSGGKDSHAIALKLLELGCHVTLITATTCAPTPLGRKNIANLARFAKTVEVTQNTHVRKTLNRLGLQMVGDISWPEHATIFTVPIRVAREMGIKLLFYGESPQAEYGGPLGSETAMGMGSGWAAEFGGFLGLRAKDLVGLEGLTHQDLEDYIPLPAKVFDDVAVQFLGQYMPWDSWANAAVAVSHGMEWRLPVESNLWAHENLDNYQTGLHDWFMFLKYGYGRGCMQASVDVRSGRVERASMLEWVKLFDGRFPSVYMGQKVKWILAEIGLSPADLLEVAARYNTQGEGALRALKGML